MKRILAVLMGTMLLFGLAACKDSSQAPSPSESSASQVEAKETDSSRVLIACFSLPEDVDVSDTDALAGASIVVKDGEPLGSLEYVSKKVQETIGGDRFRIETTKQYPLDHDPLVELASEEQEDEARSELASHIDNPEKYDTILLGYPIWWGDMPQPLYTFLEEYDFAGKTIIPFVTHGGSGMAGTTKGISQLQPDASVSDNTLCISRDDTADSEEEIVSWAKSLGVKK